MFNQPFDAEAWQDRQITALTNLFEKTVDELQVGGLPLLAGSTPPKTDIGPQLMQITLVPVRFQKHETKTPLSLTITATTKNGPARYVLSVQISGDEPLLALHRLSEKNSDIWQANYLGIGLWIHSDDELEHFNRIGQLKTQGKESVALLGVFLHTSAAYSVQAGLMSISVIYRNVLDELSESSRMARYFNRVIQQLNGQRPSFERQFRP